MHLSSSLRLSTGASIIAGPQQTVGVAEELLSRNMVAVWDMFRYVSMTHAWSRDQRENEDMDKHMIKCVINEMI